MICYFIVPLVLFMWYTGLQLADFDW